MVGIPVDTRSLSLPPLDPGRALYPSKWQQEESQTVYRHHPMVSWNVNEPPLRQQELSTSFFYDTRSTLTYSVLYFLFNLGFKKSKALFLVLQTFSHFESFYGKQLIMATKCYFILLISRNNNELYGLILVYENWNIIRSSILWII